MGQVLGADTKIVYRHYATLYFILVVDGSESELGILDLIQATTSPCLLKLKHVAWDELFLKGKPNIMRDQVFVETLDKQFENVCELDLIFHHDKAPAHPHPPSPRPTLHTLLMPLYVLYAGLCGCMVTTTAKGAITLFFFFKPWPTPGPLHLG